MFIDPNSYQQLPLTKTPILGPVYKADFLKNRYFSPHTFFFFFFPPTEVFWLIWNHKTKSHHEWRKAPWITQVVLGQLPINLQQLLVEMPHFSLNPYVVPAQLGALLSEHLPSPHAFYILKQTPSAQVLCRLHPAGCPVFQPPFISQSVTACSVYQEIRKKMCFFHEGWHSLFSPFIPTDFFFFSTLMYYIISFLSFVFLTPVFENPLENACAV